jgi:hypothetical protein
MAFNGIGFKFGFAGGDVKKILPEPLEDCVSELPLVTSAMLAVQKSSDVEFSNVGGAKTLDLSSFILFCLLTLLLASTSSVDFIKFFGRFYGQA